MGCVLVLIILLSIELTKKAVICKNGARRRAPTDEPLTKPEAVASVAELSDLEEALVRLSEINESMRNSSEEDGTSGVEGPAVAAAERAAEHNKLTQGTSGVEMGLELQAAMASAEGAAGGDLRRGQRTDAGIEVSELTCSCPT